MKEKNRNGTKKHDLLKNVPNVKFVIKVFKQGKSEVSHQNSDKS